MCIIKYIIQTYNNKERSNLFFSDFVYVVATEDNTVVNITPSINTEKGNFANVAFSVTLQKGETYCLLANKSEVGRSFSGTIVETADMKKIAVFNGNKLTEIPDRKSVV